MKTLSVVLVAIAMVAGAVGLSACGESSSQKAAREANHNIDQMNVIAAALSQKGISIDFSGKSDSTRAVPTNLSTNDLLVVHEYLTQYIASGETVLAKANSAAIPYRDPKIPDKIENGVADAKSWIPKVEKRIADLHRAAAHK